MQARSSASGTLTSLGLQVACRRGRMRVALTGALLRSTVVRRRRVRGRTRAVRVVSWRGGLQLSVAHRLRLFLSPRAVSKSRTLVLSGQASAVLRQGGRVPARRYLLRFTVVPVVVSA